MKSSLHCVPPRGPPLNLVHGAILFFGAFGCSVFFLSLQLSCSSLFLGLLNVFWQ